MNLTIEFVCLVIGLVNLVFGVVNLMIKIVNLVVKVVNLMIGFLHLFIKFVVYQQLFSLPQGNFFIIHTSIRHIEGKCLMTSIF